MNKNTLKNILDLLNKSVENLRFKLCTLDQSKGIDCFILVVRYLQLHDIRVPDKYEGYDVFNYTNLFHENPEKAIRLAGDFIASLINEVELNDARSTMYGDILQVKSEDDISTFAIDIGGGNLEIISQKHGVAIMPKRYYRIERAFRIS